ncbi:MAG: hypothetical protein K2P14_01840 [Anaeroplasmataceae bacterium]|nr:hypothetical protein [Anaeroplasmataceae bacterium]
MSKLGFKIERYFYNVHIYNKSIAYDSNLEDLLKDSIEDGKFCWDVKRKGLKIVFVDSGYTDLCDVYVYKEVDRYDIPVHAIKVVDFSMEYFVELFSLFKESHSARKWFRHTRDEYYVLKQILIHELENDLVRVAVNRYSEALGYISVTESSKYDDFIPDLSCLHDKDAVLRYSKDTAMLHKIANCYGQYYDCYCRDAMCGDDKCLEVLLNNITQELHQRGYYSLALWLSTGRNLEMYERCGFTLDSEFYSKTLQDSTDSNGNNAVRYIYSM